MQSTNVGAFAYLWLDNDSYNFELTAEIAVGGAQYTKNYPTRSVCYWGAFRLRASRKAARII